MKSKLFVPVLVALFILAGCKPDLSSSVFEYTVTPGASRDVAPTGTSAIDPTQVPTQASVTQAPTVVPTQAPTAVPAPDVPFPPTWQGDLPILAGDHQGTTFGPGQTIVAFAEGLTPDSAVTISWVHEIQGIIASISGSTDSSGQSVVNHVVRDSLNQPGARPAGSSQLTFEDQNGTKQTYAFAIDYGKTVEMTPAQCGVYPDQIKTGGQVVVWCGGLQPGSNPPFSVSVNDQALFDDSENTVDSDGLYLSVFDVFPDDPSGIWTVKIGDAAAVSFKVEP